MLLRTHFIFALFFILIFSPHVSHIYLFIGAVLVATIIPDLDSRFSSYGHHVIFRPLQFFVRHRGIIHSFTTATVLSLVVAIFYPVVAFGFFLGYTVHLLCDSFTKEGIEPFWPLRFRSVGPIATGGRMEELVFFLMIFVNLVLFFGFYLL